mgnify:CR=1 FL=1
MEYLNTAQELARFFIMRCKSPFSCGKRSRRSAEQKMDIQNWRRQKNGVSFRAENIM